MSLPRRQARVTRMDVQAQQGYAAHLTQMDDTAFTLVPFPGPVPCIGVFAAPRPACPRRRCRSPGPP